jgi:hypothetical protein
MYENSYTAAQINVMVARTASAFGIAVFAFESQMAFPRETTFLRRFSGYFAFDAAGNSSNHAQGAK